MFEEFGSLYANHHDPRFTGFIDAGKYTEDLIFFKKKFPNQKTIKNIVVR